MSDIVDIRDEFFRSVGKCLHAWGFVELELANLYMILHGVQRDAYSHPTRAAFEAVISLEVRTSMIVVYVGADGMLEKYVPYVKPLCSKIIKSYKKRHEIAHFLVVGQRSETNVLEHSLRPFLTMYGLTTDRGKELSLTQIKERTLGFNVLADRIRRHVQHVGALRALPTEFYAAPGDIAFPPLELEDLNQ